MDLVKQLDAELAVWDAVVETFDVDSLDEWQQQKHVARLGKMVIENMLAECQVFIGGKRQLKYADPGFEGHPALAIEQVLMDYMQGSWLWEKHERFTSWLENIEELTIVLGKVDSELCRWRKFAGVWRFTGE